MLKFKFRHFYNYNFYSQLYFSNIELAEVFGELTIEDIDTIGKTVGAKKKEINHIQAKYKRYIMLNAELKENVDKLLLQN